MPVEIGSFWQRVLNDPKVREEKAYIPTNCIFVIGTQNPDGINEYRVGRLSSEVLRNGLCVPINPKNRTSPLALRPDAAHSCFGGSVVYDSRKSAVADAERIYPFNNGIKVIHLCCAFPPPDLEG